MTRFLSFFRFLAVAAAVAGLHCSMSDLAGGGTIETTNGRVSGTVQHPTGAPATRTLVRLLPADYDPVKDTAAVSADTTDSMGRYAFTYVASGDYTIQATHIDNCTRTLVTGICVAKDTVTAPPGTLQAPGAIKVFLPSGVNSATGYVYIPGTTIFTFLNNHTDFVVLDSTPYGLIPAIAYSSINDTAAAVIRYNFHVAPNDTAVLWNPSWKYARTLILNTTATGANISGDVTNFPVLVRLNPDNFNFSQARTSGEDIRFTKQNNTFLPCEIERWDSAGGAAEIWVKVDTVHGNDSLQSIMMYWGNASAAGSSNGAEAFDTANGFAGVWHLGDSGTPAVFRNSTENANNGIDSAKLSDRTGIIGKGQAFQRADSTRKGDKIVIPSATSRLKPQQVTLSVWIKPTAVDDSSSDIVSMGDNYLLRIDNSGHAVFLLYWGNGLNSVWCRDTLHDLLDAQWHYLAGTYDGAQLQLRIDGTLKRTVPYTGGIPYSQGSDLVIGGHGTYKPEFDFTGNIDEVNIASTVRSPDWILLCYRNQMANAVFVRFK